MKGLQGIHHLLLLEAEWVHQRRRRESWRAFGAHSRVILDHLAQDKQDNRRDPNMRTPFRADTHRSHHRISFHRQQTLRVKRIVRLREVMRRRMRGIVRMRRRGMAKLAERGERTGKRGRGRGRR